MSIPLAKNPNLRPINYTTKAGEGSSFFFKILKIIGHSPSRKAKLLLTVQKKALSFRG
jgi:hypothetical protein